jgi:hypothetical protein
MSRRMIMTCNNCGIERDENALLGWRDPKIFYVTDTRAPYTPEVDLCPECSAAFKVALDTLGQHWTKAVIAYACLAEEERAEPAS